MDDEIMVNIHYGWVESEIRDVPIPGGIKRQSRRVVRGLHDSISFVSDWQDLSTLTIFEAAEKSAPLWRRCKSALALTIYRC